MNMLGQNTEWDDAERKLSYPCKRARHYSLSSESSTESSIGSCIKVLPKDNPPSAVSTATCMSQQVTNPEDYTGTIPSSNFTSDYYDDVASFSTCSPEDQDDDVPSLTSTLEDAADFIADSMPMHNSHSQYNFSEERQRDNSKDMVFGSNSMTDEDLLPDFIPNYHDCTQEDITEEKQRALDNNFTGDAAASITGHELRWPDELIDETDGPTNTLSLQALVNTTLTARERTAQTYMSVLGISRLRHAQLAVYQENWLSTIFHSSNPEFEKHLVFNTCMPILASMNEAVLR